MWAAPGGVKTTGVMVKMLSATDAPDPCSHARQLAGPTF